MKEKGSFVNAIGGFSNASGNFKKKDGFLNTDGTQPYVKKSAEDDSLIKQKKQAVSEALSNLNNAQSILKQQEDALAYEVGQVNKAIAENNGGAWDYHAKRRDGWVNKIAITKAQIYGTDGTGKLNGLKYIYNTANKEYQDSVLAFNNEENKKFSDASKAISEEKKLAAANARATAIATTGKDPYLKNYIAIGSIAAVTIIGGIIAYVYFKKKRIS